MGEAATHVQGGSIRILAVAAEVRDERFPAVPTFQESGLNVPVWATFRGWAVPAGTPDDIVDVLADLLAKVHESPEYREKMESAGFQPVYRNAEEFRTVINDYRVLTNEVIAAHDLAN